MKTNTNYSTNVFNRRMRLPRMIRGFLGTMLVVALMIPAVAVSQPYANPALVDLGTAINYRALAGNTTLTVGATCTVTGNVAAGVLTNNGTVTGTADIGNGAFSTAVSDLSTVKLDLFNRAADATPVVELGGQNLGRGVYSAGTFAITNGSALTLTGTATDIFIFKMTTTLTTNAACVVTLAGGALASNVYWEVGTAATIDGDFKGNILAGTFITQNGGTITGRALGTTNVTLNGTAVQPAASAAGDLILTMSGNAGNIRANEVNLQILKIAVSNTSGGPSTLSDITLTDVGTSALATDITNITFYNGDVSTSRSLGTFTAFTNQGAQIYNITDVTIPNTKTIYIYAVINLNGAASLGETFRWNVVAATCTGVASFAGASFPATVANASSVFLIGGAQSIDDNADGKVDRIKINMTGGAPQINDNTVIGSDFAVVRRSFTDQTVLTNFTAADNTIITGTTTNDNEFYVIVKSSEQVANSTGDFYEITFTGATGRLLNLGGLAASTQTVAAVDAAPPVITSSITGDNNGDGLIDRLTLTISEQVTVTDGSAADGFAGLTVSDSYNC